MKSNNITLTVDSIHKLIGLHKILHIAKFKLNENELYTKFGAEWSNTILDQVINFYEKEDLLQEANEWRSWRKLSESRLEYDVIVNKLKELKPLYDDIGIPCDEREFNIRIVASPFVLDDKLFNEFQNLL